MKKLLFFIVLSAVGFKLKAQSTSTFNNLPAANKSLLPDSVPKLSFKQQNDIKALFLPKPKLSANQNLIAETDHMPIAKPVGIWNTPVVHPNGTVVYTTPVKRLPPIVKPEKDDQKTNP